MDVGSPKKVLHSVKECILKIAFVHLGICFKVIDIESGDELLCVYPSSSPLPLLMSGFGTEVSSSIHKLEASDGELKLSGYITGPFETLSVKAFQYFYINSRYVSKGPLHKLLNQLSTMYSCSDLLKADIRSECGKRSRSQAYPTYLLNLSCPRAYYDLSFEPTKTCVAFKDWDPVLTFIKKAVSCFWSQENAFGHGADMSEEGDIWNGTGAISASDDLNDYGLPKKTRTNSSQCHQASIGLSSPQLKMSREEAKHMTLQSNNRYSCKRSRRKSVRFDEHEIEMDFACITNNSLKFGASTLPKCEAPEDLYLESKWSREPSSERIDHLSDEKWNPNSLLTSSSTKNGLVAKDPSTDSFHFVDYGDNIDENPIKPLLRSCSSGGDDKSRCQADGFREWMYMDDSTEADYVMQDSEPWQDEAATFWTTTSGNLNTDSSFLSKGSFKSLYTHRECFTEDNSFWSDPVLSIHRSNSNLDWSIHVEPHTDDVLGRHFKYHRDDAIDFSADEEEHDIFNFDNLRYSSSQGDYSWSNHMVASSSLKGHASCKQKIRNTHNDIFSSQWCEFLYGTEEREPYIPVESSHHMPSSSYANGGKNKRAQCGFQDKKPRRSHSAPPFYRGKKKFVALNNSMTGKSRKSHYESLHNVPTFEEASHLKHIQKPSGVYHLSLEEGLANDSDTKARRVTKKIIDKAEISNYDIEIAEDLDLHNTDSEFTSKEHQGAVDFAEKWRNGRPLTAGTKKASDRANEDNILDISSGILHLSGDSLLPKSISKKCLEDCRTLPQVDKKFIPVVAGGVVAVIDQHAADERIRLEDLRRKVLSGEMMTTAHLDSEQELVLPEIGYQLLHNYSEQIKKWGWICNFHAQSSVSFKKNLNCLHNQPSTATLIAVPCILGVNLTDVDLLEFLQQLADTDGSSVLPPAVLRVLNFKACRGAIMFGDALLPSECSLIVEELKQTQLCFQCAHGRPTTAPLVNLPVLHKQIAKLVNRSHRSSGPWHGLSPHRPSLERAAQRLNSDGGQC